MICLPQFAQYLFCFDTFIPQLGHTVLSSGHIIFIPQCWQYSAPYSIVPLQAVQIHCFTAGGSGPLTAFFIIPNAQQISPMIQTHFIIHKTASSMRGVAMATPGFSVIKVSEQPQLRNMNDPIMKRAIITPINPANARPITIPYSSRMFANSFQPFAA
jgi:hypothetical protein